MNLFKRINLKAINNTLDYLDIYTYQDNLIINLNHFVQQFKYSSVYYFTKKNPYNMKIIYRDNFHKYVLYTDICKVFDRGIKDFLKPTGALIARELGYRVITPPRKEVDLCQSIIALLVDNSIQYHRQYQCSRYRIDIYLPEKNIAIEINEYNHRDRDPKYESERECIIKDKLECTYHVINPDADGFNQYSMIKNLTKILEI